MKSTIDLRFNLSDEDYETLQTAWLAGELDHLHITGMTTLEGTKIDREQETFNSLRRQEVFTVRFKIGLEPELGGDVQGAIRQFENGFQERFGCAKVVRIDLNDCSVFVEMDLTVLFKCGSSYRLGELSELQIQAIEVMGFASENLNRELREAGEVLGETTARTRIVMQRASETLQSNGSWAIRQLRQQRGWTDEMLAEKTGLDIETINRSQTIETDIALRLAIIRVLLDSDREETDRPVGLAGSVPDSILVDRYKDDGKLPRYEVERHRAPSNTEATNEDVYSTALANMENLRSIVDGISNGMREVVRDLNAWLAGGSTGGIPYPPS